MPRIVGLPRDPVEKLQRNINVWHLPKLIIRILFPLGNVTKKLTTIFVKIFLLKTKTIYLNFFDERKIKEAMYTRNRLLI